eukprot:CAMPEP_0115624218 /NCGR_PEP_ID=MMETSP0272-20121206/27184_1 /TAXON_ID=71861 /ORGANISM="Scrippsiella trochoidea, Strain CCMP3099" /LENGTH=1728 /DNA_ID=CAMNT_0003060473 /DNA_START=83 /DNA_END=5266 /DNA_ORIENTATION=+
MVVVPAASAALNLSLEAFEAYAIGLHSLLGGNHELVTETLTLLLKCSGTSATAPPQQSASVAAPAGYPATVAVAAASPNGVVDWCLRDGGLAGSGPEAIARVLLVQRAIAGAASQPLSGRERLLAAAHTSLAEAPGPVAARLAEAIAQDLQDEAEAARWLRSLREEQDASASAEAAAAACPAAAVGDAGEGQGTADGGQPPSPPPVAAASVRAYARAAAALLARHRGGLVSCTQHLLPALVEATGNEGAATRLSDFASELLGRGGRAEVADALNLAVAFHEPLLEHWRLASWAGDHEDLGVRLIEQGLRYGLKENGGLRKQARFLLESTVRQALAAPGVEPRLKAEAGIRVADVNAAWKAFWEFSDALEEFGSHLLKASWDTLMGKMTQFLGRVAKSSSGTGGVNGHSQSRGGRGPPALFAPSWLEVLLCRALAHDNDTVHRFVLGQLVTLDQGVVCLSEKFVLDEMLQRFSHSIDILYPRSDVHQTFEKQTAAFFSAFVSQHAEGPAYAARKLLAAVLGVRAVHHTPLRLLLSVLSEVHAPGALRAAEALEIVERFFAEILTRMPVSARPVLSSLMLRTAEQLCAEDGGSEENAAQVATTAASVPDALLDDSQEALAGLARRALGARAEASMQDLLRGLASCAGGGDSTGITSASLAEAQGRRASAMGGARLVLGIVRVVRALAAAGGETQPFSTHIWPALAPSVCELHRRSYLPRRVSTVALFGCAYGAAVLPDAAAALDGQPAARAEALAFVEVHARAAVAVGDNASIEEEAPWVWLYALVLEKLWRPGLPHGAAVLAGASEGLRRALAADGVSAALAAGAAASLIGALAGKVEQVHDRVDLFLLLWRAHVKKPRSVTDARFNIVSAASDHGVWQRNRLEEFEELHRPDREGVGRVFEWRDLIAVFLLAKWRALAGLTLDDATATALRTCKAEEGKPGFLADALLDELETMQPPHVAFWTVVARRVAYPVAFSGERSEAEQQETLQRLCTSLRGAIAEGTGDGSTYMPRGCMAELAAALCDPCLCQAERRLWPSEDADEGLGPVTKAVIGLLALGEVAVGVARSVASPILASLVGTHAAAAAAAGSSRGASEVLSALLLHREATIVDGALSLAPDVTAGVIDTAGPGGEAALAAAVGPGAGAVRQKFCGSPGLPRILALASLDGLIERSNAEAIIAGGAGAAVPLPAVVGATLSRLLSTLRETLGQLLNPPGAKSVPNRPPTPMPMSAQHRTQLRGWQAVLVLGRRADRKTAEQLLPELFHHLAVPHVPDVRDCQELLGCALCAAYEDLAVEPLLVPALRRFDAAAQVSASLLVIASYLFRRWITAIAAHSSNGSSGSTVDLTRVRALVGAVAPYLSHNSAYVRGTAAWGFFEIFQSLGSERLLGASSGAASGGSSDGPLLADLYDFVASNKECKKMRGRLKPVFQGFEPDATGTMPSFAVLSHVLPPSAGSGPGEAATEQPPYVFTDSEFQPTSTFLNLLKDEVAHEMETLFDRSDVTQYPSISDNWQAVLAEATAAAAALPSASSTAEAGGSVAVEGAVPVTAAREEDERGDSDGGSAPNTQRKFVPLAPPVAAGDESAAGLAAGRRRMPLIIIASLVDKTPNLAGLCRTCEVFNCEALCVPNLKITKDQAFQSISVTAEKWLPIREVPRAGLKEHILELKRRGYAVVGVEQTHDSVQMDEFQFAPNTALLLGAEKEGIDADLLPLLDGCVEIPQAGQIRSLN